MLMLKLTTGHKVFKLDMCEKKTHLLGIKNALEAMAI